MRNQFLLLAFIVSSLLVSSHLAPVAFAQDEGAAWDEKYRDESHVYLLMERTVELKRDWTSQEILHIVAKIQKEGAKSLGEIPVEYDKSFQEIKDIKAFVITPDGKRLDYKSLQELDPYSGEPFYSDSRIKIITMPNVVPGNVIDWQVTVVNKRPVIQGGFWDSLSFSPSTPTKRLTYTFIMPKEVYIQMANHNTDVKPRIKDLGDKVSYTWEREFLDPFEPEEGMPPLDEFVEYVSISSLKDWSQIADWYWGLVMKNLKSSQAMRDTVKELASGKDTEKDKVQRIIQYVQDNFRYVSMSFGYNSYEPHPSDEVFNNKYGDCKDQVLVCMAMLKEFGVPSYPALYCDEDYGNPRDKLPSPGHFNHVILDIELEGKTYYTDVLEKGYRFVEFPESAEGGYVFVVNGRGGHFDQLPISGESENATFREATVTLREGGSALIEDTSLWPKESSVDLKQRWKDMTEKQKKEFMESLDESYTAGGTMLEKSWENLESRYGQIKSTIKYESSRWAEVSGDFMSFGLGGYEKNIGFTRKTRGYPIMFWPNSLHRERHTYVIPDGFEIAHLPRDIDMKSEFTEFSRTYRSGGGSIMETEVARSVRTRLPASSYGRVKDFYNQLSRLTAEKIIIKRKAQ